MTPNMTIASAADDRHAQASCGETGHPRLAAAGRSIALTARQRAEPAGRVRAPAPAPARVLGQRSLQASAHQRARAAAR